MIAADIDLHHRGAPIAASGKSISYGDQGRIVESRFSEAIPGEASVVISYLDRIEPL